MREKKAFPPEVELLDVLVHECTVEPVTLAESVEAFFVKIPQAIEIDPACDEFELVESAIETKATPRSHANIYGTCSGRIRTEPLPICPVAQPSS